MALGNLSPSTVICYIGLMLVFISSTYSKSVENSRDVVWFPSPKEDGSVIEARLTPTPNLKLGDISNIHFYLYTRDNPTDWDELFLNNDTSIDNSHFMKGAPLKFLVHGFGSSYTSGFPSGLKNEYLKLDQDLNIIVLQWELLAADPDYFLAVANTQLVSRHSADFIDFLVNDDYVSREHIHLIGYSLGGQAVGQIGSRVSEKLPRITALDPALPLFDYAIEFDRIDASDALFVDVIHVAANGFIGYRDPCGHVDWYPNGGAYQPGCGLDFSGFCAHGRAPAMYVESIFTDIGFHGRECNSYEHFLEGLCNNKPVALMGEYTPQSTRGIFYLKSQATSPYAEGPLQ